MFPALTSLGLGLSGGTSSAGTAPQSQSGSPIFVTGAFNAATGNATATAAPSWLGLAVAGLVLYWVLKK